MTLNPGMRLKSAVCETEVIVVRSAQSDVDLRCGGQPMIAMDAERPADEALSPAQAGGTLLGKRYVDDDAGIELLCTKAGQGSLAVGDVPMPTKEAKPLPSSD